MASVLTHQELDDYFGSYVGMDGGNPEAPIWFCDPSRNSSFERLVTPLQPKTMPPAWDAEFRVQHRDEMEKWLMHQRIARIMTATRADALGIPLGENDWQSYYWNRLYAPNGAEFKLSLFPMPLNLTGSTSWSQVFRGQPALVPKHRYLDLCRQGARFRFLAWICARWRPKVVVCFGHRYTEDFRRAFVLDEVAGEDQQLRPADLVTPLRVFVRDSTTWVICPAMAGSSGLTSNVQLDAFGKWLGARVERSDFESHTANGGGVRLALEPS